MIRNGRRKKGRRKKGGEKIIEGGKKARRWEGFKW